MATVKCTSRMVFALSLVFWAVRLASAQDGDAGHGREAQLCDETNAALRSEFEQAVSTRNSCEHSTDCAVLTPGCPFGCSVSIARAHASKVEVLAQELVSRSGPDCRCMYKCPAAPRAACVHGTCTTEGGQ
jgi:hypothetical protein